MLLEICNTFRISMSSEKTTSWKRPKARFTSRNKEEVELGVDMLNHPEEFMGDDAQGTGKN